MSIMESKVVFIGSGNMAEAIVSGMVRAKFCAPEKIVLTDLREERLIEMKSKLGVSISTDKSVVQDAEIVVLAVKPQGMAAAMEDIRPFLKKETLVISIAAGIHTEEVERVLGEGTRVVRVMPNTPALIGKGATAVAAGSQTDEADVEVAETILGCAGLTVRVDESDMDAVTALSGSGPAYIFYLFEAMMDAAVEMGLDYEKARTLMLQTVEGAAGLLKDSGEDASVLRAKVTSKGGTTQAAITSMEMSGVKSAIIAALNAAKVRSEELSREA